MKVERLRHPRRPADRTRRAMATRAASSPKPGQPAPLRRAGIDAAPSCRTTTPSRAATGVLRGLHFQRPPSAQGKLVRVLARRHPRCRGRHPRGLADLWPACRRRAERRRTGARSGCRAASRMATARSTAIPRCIYKTDAYYDRAADARHRLERPGARHRLAGRRRDGGAVRQGPHRAAPAPTSPPPFPDGPLVMRRILVTGARRPARHRAGRGRCPARTSTPSCVGRPDFDFDAPETIAAAVRRGAPGRGGQLRRLDRRRCRRGQ